jgi:uncharacterized protein (UPF0333 family)
MRSLKRDVKGQAAMEFLMTYGWAILAAVIAIAALAYFGVFSPSRYIPEACTLNTPLGCEDAQIKAANITLVVRNSVGSMIEVYSFNVTGCGGNISTMKINAGSTKTIFVQCIPALSQGDSFSGNINFEYLRTGDTFNKTSTGSVSGEVG